MGKIEALDRPRVWRSHVGNEAEFRRQTASLRRLLDTWLHMRPEEIQSDPERENLWLVTRQSWRDLKQRLLKDRKNPEARRRCRDARIETRQAKRSLDAAKAEHQRHYDAAVAGLRKHIEGRDQYADRLASLTPGEFIEAWCSDAEPTGRYRGNRETRPEHSVSVRRVRPPCDECGERPRLSRKRMCSACQSRSMRLQRIAQKRAAQ